MPLTIFIIIFSLVAFGILIYINKRNKIIAATKKISRKEAIIDPTMDISGAVDISGPIPVNLKISFEFSKDGAAFTPHPPSTNQFTCDIISFSNITSSTDINFTITTPSKVMICSMSFGIVYDTLYNPEQNNLGNKYIIIGYVDPISGNTYKTNNLYQPIINNATNATSATEVDLSDDPIILEAGTTNFTLSTNNKNLSKIFIKDIFAFELLPDITDKDEYGSPLWPIMKNITGTFSSGFNT